MIKRIPITYQLYYMYNDRKTYLVRYYYYYRVITLKIGNNIRNHWNRV